MKIFTKDKPSFLLTLIFVLATAMIFFIMALTYKHLEKLSETTENVTQSMSVSMKLEKLYANLKDIEIERRNYVLLHDQPSQKVINERKKLVDQLFKELKQDFKNDSKQSANLKEIGVLIHEKYDVVNKVLDKDFDSQDKNELYQSLQEGEDIMNKVQLKIEEMLRTENELLVQRKDDFFAAEKSTPIYIYLLSLFSLGLISFAFYQLNKNAKKQKEINRKLNMSLSLSQQGEEIGNYGFWRWFVKDNRFTFSKNLYRIFGMDEKTEYSNIEDFLPTVHPEDLELVENNIRKMYAQEADIKTFTHRIFRKDNNQLRYIRINNKFLNSGTENAHYLIITQDITDEVQWQHDIENQNRTLEIQNKELMAFNYVASHDLQEPLRKIETFLSRIKDKENENLSDSGKQYLERTMSSAGRMRRLISDLLQFSRTTRSENVFEKTDLNILFENALENLNPLIEEKHATINREKFPILNVIPFQIQQLFTNIISNALKYSKENVPPVISVSVELKEGQKIKKIKIASSKKFYIITFKDNGIGFENQYSEQIFDLFNRLHGKMEYEGSGIGLAICKKITDNHKGYITASGVYNEGATFTVYLPEN